MCRAAARASTYPLLCSPPRDDGISTTVCVCHHTQDPASSSISPARTSRTRPDQGDFLGTEREERVADPGQYPHRASCIFACGNLATNPNSPKSNDVVVQSMYGPGRGSYVVISAHSLTHSTGQGPQNLHLCFPSNLFWSLAYRMHPQLSTSSSGRLPLQPQISVP